jgi:hypothetical protein
LAESPGRGSGLSSTWPVASTRALSFEA